MLVPLLGDVHIVGGYRRHQVIGPALIAATAIAAAWIAARTANHRQQEQLDHDRELQAEQLAYDREQRNRQHARDAVDDSVGGVDAALRLMFEYEALIMVGDNQRNERRAVLDDDGMLPAHQGGGAQRPQRGNGRDPRPEPDRLLRDHRPHLGEPAPVLRLGKDHQIVKSQQALRDVYSTRHSTLEHLYKRPLTDEDREQVRSASKSTEAIFYSFLLDFSRFLASPAFPTWSVMRFSAGLLVHKMKRWMASLAWSWNDGLARSGKMSAWSTKGPFSLLAALA